MDIKNKTIIITGGASGLGNAVAKMVVENGGNAVLADIQKEQGEKISQQLGSNSLYHQTDVTSEEDIQLLIVAANEKFGAIHGLVNCAGVAPGKRILGRSGVHPLDLFQKTVEINLIGSFNMIRLVAAEIEKNEAGNSGERGVIVNTASVAAFEGQVGQAAYAASKAGVVGMTLPIARELARVGIRVMTIAPGIFETPMVASFTEEVKESLGAQVPFPSRLGKADEYASLTKHIFENQMLNGEVIRLDGAIRMQPK